MKMSTETTCKRCEQLRTALSWQTRRGKDLEDAQAKTRAAEGVHKWAEQQVVEAQAEAERQRLRAVDIGAELARFVLEYNITHLDGCPEDDTCSCPHVERINRLLRDCPEEATEGQDMEIARLRADLATSRAATETTRLEADRALRRVGELEAWAKAAGPVVEAVRRWQSAVYTSEIKAAERELSDVAIPHKGNP